MSEEYLVQKGDVIYLDDGDTVYTMIPKHFHYSNCTGDFECDSCPVTIGPADMDGKYYGIRGLDSSFLVGKWRVIKTTVDGGSGPGAHDPYPDGHHVFCELIVNKEDQEFYNTSLKCNFYQTGCFTAMIRPDELNIISKWTDDDKG